MPDPNCKFCGGTGEVEHYEPVSVNDPAVTAPIGIIKCVCAPIKEDYED